MGTYTVIRFCMDPPFGQANNASSELNISPYCPSSHAITFFFWSPKTISIVKSIYIMRGRSVEHTYGPGVNLLESNVTSAYVHVLYKTIAWINLTLWQLNSMPTSMTISLVQLQFSSVWLSEDITTGLNSSSTLSSLNILYSLYSFVCLVNLMITDWIRHCTGIRWKNCYTLPSSSDDPLL